MGASIFYAQAGVLDQAEAARTRLAGATIRLWKVGLTLTWSTTLAQLQTFQATFDGYPAGGIAIPTWGAPMLGPGQAAFISGGVQTFVYGSGGPGVKQLIGGWYLVTSDNVLWAAGEYPEAVPMQNPGEGQPVSLTLGFPSG